jgi:hypothetical protein
MEGATLRCMLRPLVYYPLLHPDWIVKWAR